MAKKKNQGKKHRFKHLEPGPAVTAIPEAVSAETISAPRPRQALVAATTRDFSYVLVDLRRIGVLAVSLVVFELVLWYLLGHTAIGPAIYRLFNV